LSAEAQGCNGSWGHGWGTESLFWCAADSGLEPRGMGTRRLPGSMSCMPGGIDGFG
jgi:hypothetical protein